MHSKTPSAVERPAEETQARKIPFARFAHWVFFRSQKASFFFGPGFARTEKERSRERGAPGFYGDARVLLGGYPLSRDSTPCGTWFDWASIEVALCTRIWDRVNSVVSLAKSTSRMRLSASWVL